MNSISQSHLPELVRKQAEMCIGEEGGHKPHDGNDGVMAMFWKRHFPMRSQFGEVTSILALKEPELEAGVPRGASSQGKDSIGVSGESEGIENERTIWHVWRDESGMLGVPRSEHECC